MKKPFLLLFFFLFIATSCADKHTNEKDDISDEDSQIENDVVVDEQADESIDDDQSAEIEYNCKNFTITKLENIEDGGKYFYKGTISNIDGQNEDIIKFAFLNEDGSWNYQIEEKTYNLGSSDNSNSYTCTECLWVLSDVADGKPQKYYFQESGVFKVDAAGPDIQARGTISARLIEVEIGENVVPVKNGNCIEIQNSEIDLFCYPECDGKVCGPDSCGGICKDGCSDDEYCSDDQSECIKYNCTEFTIEDLKNIEKDHRFFYESSISNIDGELEDILTFYFYNEDRSWNYQIEKKVYDLGSIDNSDPYKCMECLWVYSDIIDENPQKYYFQQSGTFAVDEAGLVIEASGTLNARLVEMEMDENEKFIPVSEGDCIEIKNAPINTLCEKQCDGKVCGGDSCGGICGDGCGNDEYCSEDQTECVEYDCKNVTVKSGLVHLGEGPGSDFEYEMGVYMYFNEDVTYQDYYDYFSVEIWSRLQPGIYDIAETTSIHAVVSSSETETGNIDFFFVEESGIIEILKADYINGVFEAAFNNLRMVEASIVDLDVIIGGKCIEINGTINATQPTVLKQDNYDIQ